MVQKSLGFVYISSLYTPVYSSLKIITLKFTLKDVKNVSTQKYSASEFCGMSVDNLLQFHTC